MPSASRAPAPASPAPAASASATELAFRRALVVANPIAGRGRGARAARELTDGLRAAGIATELFLTAGRGDARRCAGGAEASVDLIVSVGGDGTLNEVLSGCGHGAAAIAQLPLGTANVLAHELHLPQRPAAAVRAIRAGRTTLLDTAVVNGRLSFLCVGVGIDGYAVQEVERRRTGAITKLAYATAMARVLARYRPPALQLTVDGERVPGDFGFVLISNVRGYGAVFQLSRDCRYADGRAEVYGLRSAKVPSLFRMAAVGVAGRLPGRGVEFWQARRVRVAAPDDVPHQVDGDLGGVGDVDYAVTDRQVRIVVP